jgi:signal transduction histidine kinase
LRLDDGSLYTCIIQDITYRKRMEAEIIERERVQVALEKERELRDLKNRFLSMMSHELRTPLTIIGLSYDSLKKYGEIYTPDEREYALDEIYNQSQYLGAMVEDVMTLSRAEMNAFNLELEDVDFITYWP